MTYAAISSYNWSAGPHMILVVAADANPALMPLILFGVFMVTAMGTYFAQLRLRNMGDIPSSFAAAGFLTAIMAYIFTLIPGLMDGITGQLTLAVCIFVAVFGFIFLFLTRER